jgi:two-component system OmpR family response regulator
MTDRDSSSVLIVDDETSIRLSLAAFLEDYSFNVQTADSAENAIEKIKDNEIDVAIVDLRLPGISGSELITLAHDIAPETRFLVYTGSVDFELTDDIKQLGIGPEHVFLKPLPDLDMILDAIDELIKSPKGDI